MEILGKMVAGVGIFLAGLYFLNTALKQLTSRRTRILLAKYTKNTLQGGAIGAVLGAVVQSSAAISFIVAGLLSAGMMTLSQAIPVILWCNPGTTLIVVLAFLNINLVVLFVLGLAGVGVAFEKPARFPALSLAFFGIGLLFLGLNMIQTAATPFAEMKWFQNLLLQGQSSFWMSFLVGSLLTILSQSAVAIMILTITFCQSGVLPLDQTIMMIYGANFGASILTWFLSANIKGTPKQIIITQMFVDIFGSIIMVTLFYIEIYAGIPLIKAAIASMSSQVDQQMSYVCVLFNIISALFLTIVKKPLTLFLEWFCPPTQEEEWSKTQYLCDQFLDTSETALEMAVKEQTRLFSRIPLYMEEARKMDTGLLASFHKSFQSVSQEIDNYLSEILQTCHDHATSERTLTFKNQQGLIEELDQTLFDFTSKLISWKTDETAEHYKVSFLEGLDFLLLTACDTFDDPNAENSHLLFLLTGDRNELVQKMRNQFLASNQALSPDDRMTFLQVTSLYERAIWILGRIALLQETLYK